MQRSSTGVGLTTTRPPGCPGQGVGHSGGPHSN